TIPPENLHEQLFLIQGWRSLAERTGDDRYAATARSTVDTLAMRDPENAGRLLTLAAAMESLGDLPYARTLYLRVLELQPDAFPAMNNLALILVQDGQ